MNNNEYLLTSGEPESTADYIEENLFYENNDIEAIEDKFKKRDVLYELLVNSGLADQIITNEMRNELILGRVYRIDDTARMTHTDAHIIRNWLNGTNSEKMPLYLHSIKETKFRNVPAETVFKVRLVYLVHQNLKMSLNTIAQTAIGERSPVYAEIVNPTEQIARLEEEKKNILEEKAKLEKSNKKYVENIEKLSDELSKVDGKLIDALLERRLNSLIEEKVANQLSQISFDNVPMLQESNEKLKQYEKKIEDLEKVVEKIPEESDKQFRERMYNWAYVQAEYIDSQIKQNAHRGLFSRLFKREKKENPLQRRARIAKIAKEIMREYEKSLEKQVLQEDTDKEVEVREQEDINKDDEVKVVE